MGEEILDFGPVKDTMQGIIKVIGVGGGGCNAVRNMYNEGGLDEKGNPADTRTPAQKHALIALLRSLKVDDPDAEIMGHCELEGVHKACPSFPCQEYRDYFDKLAN